LRVVITEVGSYSYIPGGTNSHHHHIDTHVQIYVYIYMYIHHVGGVVSDRCIIPGEERGGMEEYVVVVVLSTLTCTSYYYYYHPHLLSYLHLGESRLAHAE